MPYLKAFGPPALLSDNDETLDCNPLSLLIATYVVLEHKGRVSRDVARQAFYPLEPDIPKTFFPATRLLFIALWEIGVNAKKRIQQCSFSQQWFEEQGISEHAQIEEAHRQLQECNLLVSAQRNGENWDYELNNKFSSYLYMLRLRKDRNRKTFSAHLTAFRQALRAAGQTEELLSSGRVGEDRAILVILLKSTVSWLEQALNEGSFEKIECCYPGPFLEGIEKRLRGDVWLSPRLCMWLREQREYHARRISDTLQQIIAYSDVAGYELTRRIQNFCHKSRLEDTELRQMLQERLSLSHSESVSKRQFHFTQPDILSQVFIQEAQSNKNDGNEIVPLHTRNHLLKKMRAKCESLLQEAAPKFWITGSPGICVGACNGVTY